MKPQTFRAASTQLALEQVQNELGVDAIILSVRQVPAGPAWQAWKRPEVEVLAVSALAGLENPENYQGSKSLELSEIAREKISSSTPPILRMPNEYRNLNNPPSLTSKEELESYLAQLTKKIAETKAARKNSTNAENEDFINYVLQPEAVTQPNAIPRSIITIKNHLERQGLDRKLITRVLTTCSESLSKNAINDEERLKNYILHQLTAYTKQPKLELLSTSNKRRIVCVVGSSGSGKTSTCAKLAAYHSNTLSHKVAWISADTVRTGAIQLARSYTDSLGLPLILAYTPKELTNAIKKGDKENIILVDTPACNPYNNQEVIALGDFLTVITERETYLTLPASTQEADMSENVAAFNPFNLTGLIITKLDETGYFGGIYNIAWRSQIPVTAFTNGTDVVRNLHSANTRALASLIFGIGPKQ
jgi:flagellar biosynthesis protein FlhF